MAASMIKGIPGSLFLLLILISCNAAVPGAVKRALRSDKPIGFTNYAFNGDASLAPEEGLQIRSLESLNLVYLRNADLLISVHQGNEDKLGERS